MGQLLHQSQYPSASKTENVVVSLLWRNKSSLIGWKWVDGLVYHCTVDDLPEFLKANLGTQSGRHRDNYWEVWTKVVLLCSFVCHRTFLHKCLFPRVQFSLGSGWLIYLQDNIVYEFLDHIQFLYNLWGCVCVCAVSINKFIWNGHNIGKSDFIL